MKKKRAHIFAFIAVFPSALLAMASLVMGDYELFSLINQNMANTVLDFACTYVSPALFLVFYVSTLVNFHISKKGSDRATGIVSFVSGILSYGVGLLIKEIVKRPRPEALYSARVVSEARFIGLWHTSVFSFPSTTTMLTFGLALPILLEKRRCGIILIALSYFIGFSVIYTGFHFPLDVAAGALFSLIITTCTREMKKPIVNYLEKHRHESKKVELTKQATQS